VDVVVPELPPVLLRHGIVRYRRVQVEDVEVVPLVALDQIINLVPLRVDPFPGGALDAGLGDSEGEDFASVC